jgi:phosphoribosylamine--glycine ligase
VVLTSAGYPGAYEKGKTITGIERAEELPGVTVYHAGTAIDTNGQLVTAGGRVLDVTAVAPTFDEARRQAYAACDLIDFEGKTFRTDIGAKAVLPRSNG